MINFGTNGFRAILNEDYTKENVCKITQALANIIKKEKSKNPVIIGYDRRFMSDYFAKWTAEVLAGNGIKCMVSESPTPTPAVMYEVKKTNVDYGIIITASHNPYIYNGYKICIKGGRDAQSEFTNVLAKKSNNIRKIKSMSWEEALTKKIAVQYNNSKEYIKNLTKFVSPNLKNSEIKILFNPMYGVTGECARLFAKQFGLINLDIINDNNDPYFNYKLPCPNESSLEEFKKQVIKGRYKIGVACDADGDRLGVIDESGNYYSSNIIMAIVYYYLVKIRGLKGDVVKNYSTSIILDKLASCFGFQCHEVPVGIKWISAKMKDTNALLGGESSGGFTIRDYTPSKDSMIAIALLLDAIVSINKPISKIVADVKKFCGYISSYIEGNIQVKNKNKVLKQLEKSQPNFSYKPVKVISEDGKKYIFEDNSWVHIRFSGTENLLRYHVEFSTEIECERNIKAIKNFIDQIDNPKKNHK